MMGRIGLAHKDANVKNAISDIFEMDELYHFVGRKARSETRENAYVMTMISREPRQIVGFSAAADKSPERIQKIVDSAPEVIIVLTGTWDILMLSIPASISGMYTTRTIPSQLRELTRTSGITFLS